MRGIVSSVPAQVGLGMERSGGNARHVWDAENAFAANAVALALTNDRTTLGKRPTCRKMVNVVLRLPVSLPHAYTQQRLDLLCQKL